MSRRPCAVNIFRFFEISEVCFYLTHKPQFWQSLALNWGTFWKEIALWRGGGGVKKCQNLRDVNHKWCTCSYLWLPKQIHSFARSSSWPSARTRIFSGRSSTRFFPFRLARIKAPKIITTRLGTGSRLDSGGQLFLVVIRVFNFLCTVRQVSEDTNTIFDTFVVYVGLLYGFLDQVDEAVDEAVALPKLLAAVVAGWTDVSENEKIIFFCFKICYNFDLFGGDFW